MGHKVLYSNIDNYKVTYLNDYEYIVASSATEAKMIYLKEYFRSYSNLSYNIFKKYYKTYTLLDKICVLKNGMVVPDYLTIMLYFNDFEFFIKNVTEKEIIDMYNQIKNEVRQKGTIQSIIKNLLLNEKGILEIIKLLSKELIAVKVDVFIYGRLTIISIRRILKKCRNNDYYHIWRLF